MEPPVRRRVVDGADRLGEPERCEHEADPGSPDPKRPPDHGGENTVSRCARAASLIFDSPMECNIEGREAAKFAITLHFRLHSKLPLRSNVCRVAKGINLSSAPD